MLFRKLSSSQLSPYVKHCDRNKRVTRRRGQVVGSDKITLDKRVNFSSFIAIKPTGVNDKSTDKSTDKSPAKSAANKAPAHKVAVLKPVEKQPVRRVPRTRPTDKVVQRRLTELDLHYDNIKTVLRCSNATPIRTKVNDKYSCGYCLDQFVDPRDLKAHTIETHSDTDDKPECLCIRSLSKYCVHLDVTDLRCNLCDAALDKLEDLIEHLKLEHDELIHTNIRNLLVPYKFKSLEVNCVVCLKQFDDYSDLQQHMSDHYKNYVCEFCDKAFLLRSTMIEHKKVVHRRKQNESTTRASQSQPKESTKLTRRNIITITPKPPVKLKKRSEIHKHHDNVTTILRHSNATPIRSKGSLGYTCCFCSNQYLEAADLKSHTLAAHDKQNLTFKRGRTMLTFMVKLDITSLHCKICGHDCHLLEDLVQHLSIEHSKPFHTDIKNYLVPFKFDPNVLRCVLCQNKFNNFKVLLEHMNSHYRNHVCEVCGEGFVNKRILLSHSYRHKKGVFNCTHCAKVFDTKVKQKEHERAVHICMNRRNKCGYCGEKFTDYTKKNEHEVKMHGAKAILLKCQACNRSFDNQRALTVHTKSYHLLEGRMRK